MRVEGSGVDAWESGGIEFFELGEFSGGIEGFSWLFVGDCVSGVADGGCWDGDGDFLAAGYRDRSGGGVGPEGLAFSFADGVSQVVAYVVLLAELDDFLVDFLGDLP